MNSVLITGASAGFGLALLHSCVNNGVERIYFTSRSQTHILSTLEKLPESSRKTHIEGLLYDQSELASIDRLIDELLGMGTLPECLILNIGINDAHTEGFRKTHNLDLSSLEKTLKVNVTHVIYLLSKLLASEKKQDIKQVILIGSLAYKAGIKGQIAYNTSKAALLGVTNTLRNEYRNIRFDLFEPGIMHTERLEKYIARLVKLGIHVQPLDEAVSDFYKFVTT